jgi:drug/metabolite transporter (DMT)-like permease
MTKPLLTDWMTPLGYNISRMLFGLAMFWIISLFQKRENVPIKDLLFIFAGGFLGITLTNPAFAIALNYTSPAIWSIIIATSPIVVLFLSFLFLKESFVPQKVIGISIGIAGALIIIMENTDGMLNSSNTIGILIALITVVCLSFSMLIMRKLSIKYSPVTQMKWMLLLSVLILGPVSIPELPEQRIYSSEIQLLPLLLLGFCMVFSSGLAFFLQPVALKYIDASTAGVYISAQPLAACTASIITGQDTFSLNKLIAFVLVTAGLLLITRSTKKIIEIKGEL